MVTALIVYFADEVSTPLAAALVAAILGPVGAYVVAARKMSGKIGTSDADQLWAESKAIRDWSTGRLEALEEENKELRKAVSDLSSKLAAAQARIAALEQQGG